jgi:hypothetical protein
MTREPNPNQAPMTKPQKIEKTKADRSRDPLWDLVIGDCDLIGIWLPGHWGFPSVVFIEPQPHRMIARK